MAEAAGLALGAVALASLFQTCVEFLEYFEVARNLSDDGELVSTKLHLLETRLRSWGCQLKVLDPSREVGGWHVALEDELEGGIVGRCLVGIRDILGDASKLKTKYGLDKRKCLAWNSYFPFLLRPPQKAKIKPFSGTVSLRRHVVWAVRDKKRFDSLIHDLDFFITNLEKVGSHLSRSEDDRMNKIHTLSDSTEERKFGPGRLLGSAPVQGQNYVSEQSTGTSSERVGVAENMDVPKNESKGSVSDGRNDQQAPAKQAPLKGSKYSQQKSKDKSKQLVGAVGAVAERQNNFKGQVSHDESKQQVGDSSEAFAAAFFSSGKKHTKK